MIVTDTVQFIDAKPVAIDGDEYSDPAPRRTFDLRTSEERLMMWCASLERRIEDQAARITGLELTNEKQARHIEHLELFAHRWLNAGEVPEYPQVEP